MAAKINETQKEQLDANDFEISLSTEQLETILFYLYREGEGDLGNAIEAQILAQSK